MAESKLAKFTQTSIDLLNKEDAQLYELLERELGRQTNVLAMVAASSIAPPSVLICEGLATANVTTEGYPGARFHAGCEVVDEIENLAVTRAKAVFHAQYANVQPHSGTSANGAVIFSLLKPGDTILGMELNSGGHLTHGAAASVVGQYFNAIGYGVNQDGFIDYEQVRGLAQQHQPQLIICGASAYPRAIDFMRFREIADEVGAYVMADISHIAGLVAAGEHPSPIDHAHFTTTSTYKQLYGPRGGLILIGRDYETPGPDGKKTLPELIQRAVFPYFQGTPNLSAIAAKARALAIVASPEFKKMTQRIVVNAKALAEDFIAKKYRVLTGGTDNHMALIDVFTSKGLTGVIAEKALEACNIIINKNRIAGDKKSVHVTSGMRLGSNSLAFRGMGPSEMRDCADLIDQVLSAVQPLDESHYELAAAAKENFRAKVQDLCRRFPIPDYPG